MLLLIQRLGLLGQMNVLPAEELDCADHVERVVLCLSLHHPQLIVQLDPHRVQLDSLMIGGAGSGCILDFSFHLFYGMSDKSTKDDEGNRDEG